MIIEQEIYNEAFANELSVIWGQTPFANEIDDLCYRRGTSVFLRGGDYGNVERRKLMYLACQPFFGSDDVKDVINKAYNRLPNDNLLVKRIVNNLCQVYSTEPVRELSDRANEQLKNIEINYILEQVEKTAYLTGSCLVRPYFKDKQLNFFTYSPDNYRIKYDNYGNINEVWICKTNIKSKYSLLSVFEVWDENEIRKIEGGKLVDTEPNPYGFLPFAELNISDFDNDFHYQEGGAWELCELQLISNIFDLLILENSILGGVGVWLGTNLKVRDENLKFGFGRILSTEVSGTGVEPTLEWKGGELNSDIIQQVKSSFVKDKLKDYGLPASVIDDSGVLSGTAMEVDRLELLEIRKSKIKVIRQFDKELFSKIDLIAQSDNIPFGSDYSITFGDVETIYDPIDEFELNEKKYNVGLMSKIDWLRKLGHQGTDEELINKLQEINEQRSNEPTNPVGAEAQREPANGNGISNNPIGVGDIEEGDGGDEEIIEI